MNKKHTLKNECTDCIIQKKNHDNGIEENRSKIIIFSGIIFFLVSLIIDNFTDISKIYVLLIFIASYIILGGNVILKAVKNILSGKVFDENFLMSLATVCAFAIGEYPEAISVMLFYQIGEYFQNLAVNKSRKSITDLINIKPDYANIIKDGKIVRVNPDEVRSEDIIIVKPGEKIPLDSVVIKGNSFLDTSSITGEHVPRSVKENDTVLSGTINTSGVLECRVIKEYKESTVSKIIDLVENSVNKKTKTENFITKFSQYYTPVIVLSSILLVLIPTLLFDGDFKIWLNRSLIFLVISCPCALVLSIPLSYFGGIGNASKKGILIKGSSYLESLSNLKTVVFDKTGTLTKGIFEVKNVINKSGYKKDDLIKYVATLESFSNHPVASAIAKYYNREIDKEKIKDYKEYPGYGIKAKYEEKDIIIGNEKFMLKNKISFEEEKTSASKIYISIDKSYAGCIIISDELKENAIETLRQLKSEGIEKTVMLTGDNKEISEEYSNILNIDKVYSNLLPNDKVEIVEKLMSENKGKLAFIGDGINDAPVIAVSDIGISMGGLGSDAAIEVSDIVLMRDNLESIVESIRISKFTKRIVLINIILSLSVKFVVLLLGGLGMASMWEAVFADVGVSLIAVFNAIRILRKK